MSKIWLQSSYSWEKIQETGLTGIMLLFALQRWFLYCVLNRVYEGIEVLAKLDGV